MVAVACVVTLLVWAGAAIVVGLAAVAATRSALLPFERAVLGLLAALFVPVALSTWAWFLPLGRYGGILAGALLSAALGAAVLRTHGPVPRAPRPDRRTLLEGLPVVGFVLAIGAVSTYAAAIKPVDEWDALMYHGPTAANLLSHGSLFGWDAPVPYVFYPSLGAIASAMGATVTHSSNVLDMVQVPFVVLLALVAWAWAGSGRVRLLPGAIVCGVVVNPAVYGQLRALMIDVVYSTAVVAGFWLTWLWLVRGRPRVLLVLAGFSIGCAAGSKPSGLVLSLAWTAIVGLLVLVRREPGVVRTGLALAGAVGSGGAAFYVRNLLEFHNPVFPVQVELPFKTLYGTVDWSSFYNDFPEFRDTPRGAQFFQNLWYSATDPPYGMTHDVRVGGFGRSVLVYVALALVGLVVAAVVALGRSSTSTSTPGPRRLRAVAAPLVFTCAYVLLQPQSWYPRYSIPAYTTLAVAIALLLEPLVRYARASAALGLVLLGSWGLVARDVESRLWHGIARLHHYEDERPFWDDTVTGQSTAFENSYDWMRGVPCGTDVAVEYSPDQQGLFSTFSLGLFGNGLCNDVHTIEWPDGPYAPDGSDQPALADSVAHDRYIVVRAEREPVVRALAEAQGATATVVGKNHPFGGLAAVPQVAIEIDRPGDRG